MNKKIIYVVSLLALVFLSLNSCKKDSPSVSSEELEEKLITNLTALHDVALRYSKVFDSSQDTLTAFDTLVNNLANHPDVSGGWIHNSQSIEVEFANGLKSTLSIIRVGEGGEHLTRGGGNADDLEAFSFKKMQNKAIKNEKAIVLIPYPDEFLYYSSNLQLLKNSFQSDDLSIDVEIEKGNQVELSDLDRMSDYGLIILDVHGSKYGFDLVFLEKDFESKDLWFPTDIIAEAFNVHSIPPGKLANGEIELGLHIRTYKDGTSKFQYTVHITESYIRKLNIDLSDAIVFGNHCFSGHTADGPLKNNMPEAWRSKGAATYYGYADLDGVSQLVDNGFCQDMELVLVKNLVGDRSVTGEAHLDEDEQEYFYLPSVGYIKRAVRLEKVTTPPEPTAVWPLLFLQYFSENHKYESGCDTTTATDIEYQTVQYATTSTRLKYFTECFFDVPYKEDAKSYEFVWKEFSWSGNPNVRPKSTPIKWTNASKVAGEEEDSSVEYIAAEQVFRIFGTASYYDVGVNASEQQIADVISEYEADFKTIQGKVRYEICLE